MAADGEVRSTEVDGEGVGVDPDTPGRPTLFDDEVPDGEVADDEIAGDQVGDGEVAVDGYPDVEAVADANTGHGSTVDGPAGELAADHAGAAQGDVTDRFADGAADALPVPASTEGPQAEAGGVEAAWAEDPDPTGLAMVVVEPDGGDEVVVHVPAVDPEEVSVVDDAPALRSRTSHVVLRHVRVRSVAKLSAAFYLCMCVVLLVAGVVLWVGASALGAVANIESFIRDAGFNDFRFLPGQLLRAFVVLGFTLTVVGTLANILLAALFNALSDIVGGLRFTLAEDSSAERGR